MPLIVGGRIRGSAVDVLRVNLGPGVRETVRQHAAIHPALEVGGILVDGASYGAVRVHAVIPSFSAPSPGAPLTLTPATWKAARAELSRYPGMEIVGWYRTRRHGHSRISPETLEAQAQYFASRGQLLLLTDTPDADETLFTWDGETLTRLADHQLSSSPPTAGERRAPSRAILWAQRVTCAAAGVALGWAIWSVAIDTGGSEPASTSRSVALGSAQKRAHPIVVEPQAGGPASEGTP